MADGIEARARRLKQLKRDLGVPAVRPKPVHVELFDQFLEPLGPLAQGEGTCQARCDLLRCHGRAQWPFHSRGHALAPDW